MVLIGGSASAGKTIAASVLAHGLGLKLLVHVDDIRRGKLKRVMQDAVGVTDGTVSLRSRRDSDVPLVIAARDDEFYRWLAQARTTRTPTACIVVNDAVVGWVDYDHDRDHDWFGPSEVNLGYFVFAAYRGKGHASRAVGLLVAYLQENTDYKIASLLVDPRNGPSIGVARRCHFTFVCELKGQLYFKRSLS